MIQFFRSCKIDDNYAVHWNMRKKGWEGTNKSGDRTTLRTFCAMP